MLFSIFFIYFFYIIGHLEIKIAIYDIQQQLKLIKFIYSSERQMFETQKKIRQYFIAFNN